MEIIKVFSIFTEKEMSMKFEHKSTDKIKIRFVLQDKKYILQYKYFPLTLKELFNGKWESLITIPQKSFTTNEMAEIKKNYKGWVEYEKFYTEIIKPIKNDARKKIARLAAFTKKVKNLED